MSSFQIFLIHYILLNFSILISFVITNPQLLSIPLTYENNFYKVKALIGASRERAIFAIDISHTISWIYYQTEIITNSSSVKFEKKGNEIIFGSNVSIQYIYESIELQSDIAEISDFSFCLPIKKVPGNTYDSLGFGFDIKEEKGNLILSLYNERKIPKKIFGLSIEKKNKISNSIKTNGVLYLGGISSEMENKKYSANLNVGNNMNSWGSFLSGIKIGDNEEIIIGENVLFKTNFFYIRTPVKLLDKIKNVILSFKKNKECVSISTSSISYKTSLINCDCKLDEQENNIIIPKITFNFNHNNFILMKKNLITKNFDKCELTLYGYDDWPLSNSFKYIFGTAFISLFDAFFDYDNRAISLYSNEIEIINHFTKSYDVRVFITILNSLILFCFIVFILFAKE